MEQHFTKKDIIILLTCLFLIVTTGFFEYFNYGKAFPEQAITFHVNRKKSRQIAEQFLQRMNVPFSDYQHAVTFDYDDNAKTFLEKEVGIEESKDLLSDDFKVWKWANRWFKPLYKEELKVGVSLDGIITHFEHAIPEEAPAQSLSVDKAKELCNTFLVQSLQIDLTRWEFLEEKTDVKPNRIDYLFTYKKKGIEVCNATYRMDITVQGNQIGQFQEYLKVPEQWMRDYQHLRSLNTATTYIASIFFILILIAALVTFILHLSKKDIHLKTACVFGTIAFILQLASNLNNLPVSIYQFDTNQSLGNFYGSVFLKTFLESLFYGLLVVVITGAGEVLYRHRYVNKLSLSGTFSLIGIRTKRFLMSSVVGITLAIVFMAFQTLFYLIAKSRGAWAPADVSYSDVLNTTFPWIFVLLTGFIPAVTEEFSFRMFSIPFFEKTLKSKALAILIPALIWGFAHANYPNQPFWIRGFEVSLFGIFVGIIFLKFDILALLVWHYTVNAVYTSFILVKTGDTYLVITAIVSSFIILIPLIYNIASRFRYHEFANPHPLLNETQCIASKEPTITSAEIKIPEDGYQPLSKKRYRYGYALIIAFILVCFLPVERIGEFYRYTVTKKEALETAKNFLAKRGIDPEAYRNAIGLTSNYDALQGQYILENASVQKLNMILSQDMKNASVWCVRLFKPHEKEEYQIYVNPMDNTVIGFDHILAEDAADYSLTQENARLLAEEFLTQQNYWLRDFHLVETHSQKLKNRSDYTFIWESNPGYVANVADAHMRLKTVVKGDEVATFEIFYKLPEEWTRNRTQKTLTEMLHLWLQILTIIGVVSASVFFIEKKVKHISIRWKIPVIISVCMAVLVIISELTAFKSAKLDYNTTWSYGIWNMAWILLTLVKGLGIWGITIVVVTIVLLLYPSLPNAFTKDQLAIYSKDAIFVSIVVITGILGFTQIRYWLISTFAPDIFASTFEIPDYLSYSFPLIHAIVMTLYQGILLAGFLAIVVYLFKHGISKPFYRILSAILLVFIFQPVDIENVRSFLANSFSYSFLIIWLYIGIKFFLRNNISSYLYTGIGYIAVTIILELFHSGSSQGWLNAFLMILMAVLAIILILTETQEFTWKKLLTHFPKKY